MLYLWIFGNNVEDVLGRGRYLLLYLTCGIVAALAQAFSNPTSHIPMVGASGAIAGVLGAYLLLHPGANVRCFVWIVIFFRIVNVPAWTMLGLWFAMQLVSGLMAAPGRPGVAFWAHVGGFVTGLVLVIVLRPSGVTLLQPPRSQAFATAPPGCLRRPRPPIAARCRKPAAGPSGRAVLGNELSFEAKIVIPGRPLGRARKP